MRKKRWPFIVALILFLVFAGVWTAKKININTRYTVGQPIDSLNGVIVYYNGGVGNVSGRNVSADNYNIGQKYQCVEFVKRYYYEYLNHKMPDPYGHAVDFFDKDIGDGKKNSKRNLIQYSNPSQTVPKQGDLIIFAGTSFNRFGHVAIISNVMENEIEIIQQNPGPHAKSRVTFPLVKQNTQWKIENDRVLGWLRKETN